MTYTRAEILAAVNGAAVVLGVLPDESYAIVRGEELLREISDGRETRELRIVHIPVKSEADLAALQHMLEAN